MRGFQLKEILLLSLREKRAKRVKFHPKVTVVKGVNDTGKSSLLKSIYKCLGATPQRIHPKWRGADVRTLMTFAVGDKTYRILEEGRRYTVFNAAKVAIKSFTSVTNGLGPYLAGLLNFRLKLISRENQVVTPPPAYMFLPFYVDQDEGWVRAWNSFTNLAQFSDWKKTLAEYFTGIRPNEFYAAKGESEAVGEQLKPLAERHEVLRSVLLELEARLKLAQFSLDIDAYRKEIKELLVVCGGLKKKEEEIKATLVSNHNLKTLLETQLAIVEGAVAEIHADYEYATDKLDEDHVDCPTCGAHYSNSFAERFSIARDEERCHTLRAELVKDLDAVDRKIAEENSRYAGVSAEFARVSELLQAKQGEVQLKDLIESEGRREVQNILRKDIDGIRRQMHELEDKIAALKVEMQKYDDKGRRADITKAYRQHMREHLAAVAVHTVNVDKLNVASDLKETGSDTPRALLAYYFSVLHLIRRQSPAMSCPVILDSPNQQDQDKVNLRRVLRFIRDQRPEGTQLVLGLVDDCGIEFEGDVIELSEKLSLLQEDDYKRHSKEVMEYMDKSAEFARASSE